MTDKEITTSKGTRYYLDNIEVSEAQYRARYPLPDPGRGVVGGDSTCWSRGLASDACALHPKQAEEHAAICKQKGLPEMQIRGDGRIVFRDRAHRKAYCKAFGFVDRDGGYGDP